MADADGEGSNRQEKTSANMSGLRENFDILDIFDENGEDNEVPSNDSFYEHDIMDLEDDIIMSDSAAGSLEAAYIEFGEPRFKCKSCGAMMWYDERVGKHHDTPNHEFTL